MVEVKKNLRVKLKENLDPEVNLVLKIYLEHQIKEILRILII